MSRIFVVTLFLLVVFCNSFAQNKADLQDKYSKILNEITDAETVLKQTKKNKEKTLSQLEIIKSMIDSRENLIENIAGQVKEIDNDISETQDVISSLGQDLDTLKANYAKLIYYAYKNQSSDDQLLYVFAASSFNDAFQRLKYMQRIADYREKQANLIIETQLDLQDKIVSLEEKKEEKLSLLGEQKEQKNQLDSEKNETNQLVTSLKTQEQKLKSDIDAKKKAATDLNSSIQKIIADEIAAAKKKAEEEAKKNALTNPVAEVNPATPKKESDVLALTPEDKLLSTSFSTNKGKLPWPVERGVITGKFGKQPHPVLEGVFTNNNGIDIKAEPGSHVRCIFEGTVVAITFNPTFQKAVLVRHGDYFTVYSNLTETFVKVGDKLTTKQEIGKVYTNLSDNITEVHLEIWQGTTTLDPGVWVKLN